MKERRVVVNDRMQRGYVYHRTEPVGRNFAPEFRPQLTPKQMLAARRVRRQVHDRLPARVSRQLVRRAKLCAERHDARLNYFGVNASQSLAAWRRQGLDPSAGPARLVPVVLPLLHGPPDADDARQIRRWRAIARHVAAIRKNCEPGDLECRRRQRQAVLHWAYDSRKI